MLKDHDSEKLYTIWEKPYYPAKIFGDYGYVSPQ